MTERFPTVEVPLVKRPVPQDQSVSVAVVVTVASVSDDPIEDMPLLYDAIDPDVLERSLARAGRCQISFQYNGYIVEVTDDQTVAVYGR
jgi:hypothetical protein